MSKPLQLYPFPKDFPNKGRFAAWSKNWDRIGYRDTPQYPGQIPVLYPEDATCFECFLGGYLSPREGDEAKGLAE